MSRMHDNRPCGTYVCHACVTIVCVQACASQIRDNRLLSVNVNRLSLSTEEGHTLKLSAPLKINLLKLKLLCEDNNAKCIHDCSCTQ